MNKSNINEEKIYLRFAEVEDCEDLFKWRNNHLSIKHSLTGKVDYNTHKRWFNEKINDILPK